MHQASCGDGRSSGGQGEPTPPTMSRIRSTASSLHVTLHRVLKLVSRAAGPTSAPLPKPAVPRTSQPASQALPSRAWPSAGAAALCVSRRMRLQLHCMEVPDENHSQLVGLLERWGRRGKRWGVAPPLHWCMRAQSLWSTRRTCPHAPAGVWPGVLDGVPRTPWPGPELPGKG